MSGNKYSSLFHLFSHIMVPLGSVPSWIQNVPPKSPQKVPKFLKFHESEDYKWCEGITPHLVNVTPRSGQWDRCRLRTVSTSPISPMKLHALPLARALLLQLWDCEPIHGCSGSKQHFGGSPNPNKSAGKGGQELICCFLALPTLGTSGRFG